MNIITKITEAFRPSVKPISTKLQTGKQGAPEATLVEAEQLTHDGSNAVKATILSQDDIERIAIERKQKETIAALNAKKAQEYYFNLSNSCRGKSAQESAEVIQESINNAAKAQEYYFSFADSSCGKSAQESAEAFKKAGMLDNKFMQIITTLKKHKAVVAIGAAIGALIGAFAIYKARQNANTGIKTSHQG